MRKTLQIVRCVSNGLRDDHLGRVRPRTSSAASWTPYDLTIDPSRSSVTLSGDIAGVFPFQEQAPGSLTAALTGNLQTYLLQGGTSISAIQLPGGSDGQPVAQAGPFQPGNASADFAGSVDLSAVLPGVIATGAWRNVHMDLTSATLPLDSGGNFFDHGHYHERAHDVRRRCPGHNIRLASFSRSMEISRPEIQGTFTFQV